MADKCAASCECAFSKQADLSAINQAESGGRKRSCSSSRCSRIQEETSWDLPLTPLQEGAGLMRRQVQQCLHHVQSELVKLSSDLFEFSVLI